MALFKTRSAAVYGIDAHLMDVEVDLYSSGSARDLVMLGMLGAMRSAGALDRHILVGDTRRHLSGGSRDEPTLAVIEKW